MDDGMTSYSSVENSLFRDYLSFKDLLDDAELDSFLAKCPKYRRRIYTPDAVLISFVGQALTSKDSCKDAVQNVLLIGLRTRKSHAH
jgi:hypothetical protein